MPASIFRTKFSREFMVRGFSVLLDVLFVRLVKRLFQSYEHVKRLNGQYEGIGSEKRVSAVGRHPHCFSIWDRSKNALVIVTSS
jgi:hypothetical protein